MCGLAGISQQKSEKVKKAIKRMAHRGPDGQGFFEDEIVSLGHCRLAVLDLSDAAKQPMVGESAVLVYNGEIYNFKELRNDLKNRGHEFKSVGDSEVILHGYEEYGTDFFEKMRGMWAFAIYDKKNRKIVLSRDYFGIKPLYYAIEDDKFIFASEMKGIKEMIQKIEPNRDFYFQFFNLGYFLAPQTYCKNVKRIEPGEIVIWDIETRQLSSKKIEFLKKKDILTADYISSFDKSVDFLEKQLAESVRTHYVSDVPVGLLLSGGNDSALLAALSIAAGEKPVAYNVAIRGSVDADYAKEISRILGLKLVSIDLTEKSLQKQYQLIWQILDEPLADFSIIPTSLIYSSIRDNNKVVLSGEGGDELFGGYRRHNILAGMNAIKTKNALMNFFNFLDKGISCTSSNVLKLVLNRMQNVALNNFENDVIGTYLHLIKIIDHLVKYQKIRNSFFDLYSFHESKKMQANLFFDKFAYLPNNLMYKNDIASMASSIEARVPFLDKNVFGAVVGKIKAEYCLSPQYKNKILLKKILEKYLPPKMVYRPKTGFIFSFKKYNLKEFFDDVEKAVEFHAKNIDIFGLNSSDLTCLLQKKKTRLLIDEYPRFAFALVSNWKIMA